MVTITLLGCATLYAIALWLITVFERMIDNLIRKWLVYPITAISLIIITGLSFDLKINKFAHPFKIMFPILYIGIAIIAFSLIGIILSALVHKIEKHSLDKSLINESNKSHIDYSSSNH